MGDFVDAGYSFIFIMIIIIHLGIFRYFHLSLLIISFLNRLHAQILIFFLLSCKH